MTQSHLSVRSLVFAAMAAGAALSIVPAASAQTCQPFKLLVFTKTAGFNHATQIVAGTALIQSLGSQNGFVVDQTSDATQINTTNLAQYAAVVFLHTTGDILNASQEAAFQAYILGGGGFVGVHSATDTEYGWPFYGTLIGTWFLTHPAVQGATVTVTDPNHPSTATLPATFTHVDEWYDFQTNVAANPLVHVLLTVDESTYTGGTMGAIHPIAWYQDNVGMGRSWYTAMGHDLGTYSAPFFHDHLLGGILFAAGSLRTKTICGGQPYGASSGTPTLTLGGGLSSPSTGTLALIGATPGAAGVIGISSCPASMPSGSLTILIDLAYATLVPIAFDAAGQWQLLIPLTLQLPGSVGNMISIQGAEVGSTIGLSNGVQILLCP